MARPKYCKISGAIYDSELCIGTDSVCGKGDGKRLAELSSLHQGYRKGEPHRITRKEREQELRNRFPLSEIASPALGHSDGFSDVT